MVRVWRAKWTGQKIMIARTVIIALFILLWELLDRLALIDPAFISGPSKIAFAIYGLIASGEVINPFRVTITELAVAFVMAASLGITLGLIIGVRKYLRPVLDPFIMVGYAIPKVTLFALFLLFFGTGMDSKMTFGLFYGFFPIIINTIAGTRDVKRTYLIAARSMGASSFQIYSKVFLPSILPAILSGLRLGVISSFIGVLLGEMIAAREGIGVLISTMTYSFRTPELYGAVIVIALVAITINQILITLERRTSTWRY